MGKRLNGTDPVRGGHAGILSGATAAIVASALVFGAASGADAQTAGASKEPQNAWVKLCNKQPFPKRDAAGKLKPGANGRVESEVKDVCLTHHERIDGRSGVVLVSAAIRQIQGEDKKSLLLMVPLGMALPPGVKAAVYTPAQWKEAQAGKKLDEGAISPIQLKYTMCQATGCFAEIPADDKLIQSLKSGGGLMVGAMNMIGRPIILPVDLTGFTKAYDGGPVDSKLYAEARQRAMQQIFARRKQLIEEERKKRAAAPAQTKKQ
ncbi:MAG: invasion associated locus B family protein [Pseudomonadota bacterium]